MSRIAMFKGFFIFIDLRDFFAGKITLFDTYIVFIDTFLNFPSHFYEESIA